VNVQTAYAKALLVDRVALAQAQAERDVLAANRALQAAFETDVRPLLAQVRQELSIAADPVGAFRASGYAERVAKERG
jgi:L-rhamnose isomerase/sugar isomerase